MTLQTPNQQSITYHDMISLYESLMGELDLCGTTLGNLTETFGVNRIFKIPFDSMVLGDNLEDFNRYLQDYPWDQRKNMEKLHYNKLRYSLSHSFAENWFYKKEWIAETRRVIALSSDCISAISLYARTNPHRIIMSAYFRSSHLVNLFPVDFDFLVYLPWLFMEDIRQTVNTFNIPHLIPKMSDVTINLSFGNLHR